MSLSTLKMESFSFDDSHDPTLSIMDSLSPQSLDSPFMSGQMSPASVSTPTPEPTAAPDTPAKKPVKKRKSWGQELPTPTTNLPPRKRAKTDAEKEQRRIERVLRNRAAAQSSRERKRKEVEALEMEKNQMAEDNKMLLAKNQELEALVRELSARVEHVVNTNLKLSAQIQELYGHKDMTIDESHDHLLLTPPSSITHDLASPLTIDPSTPMSFDGTLDPSHLSTPSELNEDHFSLTQHTADMLCHSQDLPCQLKTGLSLNKERMLAITQWTLLTTTVLFFPLLTMILFLVAILSIPETVLLNFLLICLLSLSEIIQRPRCQRLTINLTCALLSDATGLVAWFESASRALDCVLLNSRNKSIGLDEQSSLGWRKAISRYLNNRGRKDSGAFKPDIIRNGRVRGIVRFNFSALLLQGNG